MSSYYNLLASKKRAAFPPSLLLDLYPSASVAYSLRKLRTAYSGNAIRVRRSSDDAEQDIGFVSNELDTTSMLNFVGYNLWTYSEDISNAVWSKLRLNTTGTPAYIDVETSPDGTLTGDKIIEATGTANTHYINRATQTLINGIDYNVSVYLKQSERTNVRIASNIAGVTKDCYLDLTNGSISSNTFTNTPIVTTEANGWYRFSVTITSGTTSSTFPLSVNLLNASNQLSYSGDGISGCYVWGFQLSQTSSVKPYQKTVAIVAGNGFVTRWYDQSTNVNDAATGTIANQAQIVLSGAMITDIYNGKITTAWTGDQYPILTSIPIAQNFIMFAVVTRAVTTNSIFPLGSALNFLFSWNGTGAIQSQITTGLVTHASGFTTIGDYIVSVLRDNLSVLKAFRNSTALTTGVSTGTPTTALRFGFSQGASTTGRMQEMVFWNNQDLESSRSNIETAINSYYSAF